MNTTILPLGIETARQVLTRGRAAFFGDARRDLPVRGSEVLRQDDLTPSFGFVSRRYPERRVLFLGINPGNGPSNDRRTPDDELLYPHLRVFAADPSEANYLRAAAAYRAACVRWPVWTRHCAALLRSDRLVFDQIAYANALPWRTASEANFTDDVARNAARLFVAPLLAELKPAIIVALGKRAGGILALLPRTSAQVFVWNRAQAATEAVRADRERTAQAIMAALGSAFSGGTFPALAR